MLDLIITVVTIFFVILWWPSKKAPAPPPQTVPKPPARKPRRQRERYRRNRSIWRENDFPLVDPVQISVWPKARPGMCDVCCRSLEDLRFRTERSRLCRRCVEFFEDEAPLHARAIHAAIKAEVEAYVERVDDAGEAPDLLWNVMEGNFLVDEITERVKHYWSCDDAEIARQGWWWFMRAYHLGIVDTGAWHTYPEDWEELARNIRRQDGMRCCICGKSGVELHVHHMIPLNSCGTNDPRNLVTLCYECHRAQHPGYYFDLGTEG